MLGTLRVLRAMVNARWAWFEEKAKTRNAEMWLGLYSFFETVIIPFPTDPFLAVMVYANKGRWVWLTILTTLTSLAAAFVGYLIAYFSYDLIGAPLASFLGIADKVAALSTQLDQYTFVATFIGAFTPVPYGPVILAAGFFNANFFLFLLAAFLGRALRFGIVAGLTYVFGVSIVPRLGKWANILTVSLIGVGMIVLLFIVLFL